MISPGLPAFPLVLGLKIGKTVWQQCGEQMNPFGVQTGLTYTFGCEVKQGRFEETCMASIFINNECVVLTY